MTIYRVEEEVADLTDALVCFVRSRLSSTKRKRLILNENVTRLLPTKKRIKIKKSQKHSFQKKS